MNLIHYKKTIAKHCWPLDVHKVGNVITLLNHSWSDFRLEKTQKLILSFLREGWGGMIDYSTRRTNGQGLQQVWSTDTESIDCSKLNYQ